MADLPRRIRCLLPVAALVAVAGYFQPWSRPEPKVQAVKSPAAVPAPALHAASVRAQRPLFGFTAAPDNAEAIEASLRVPAKQIFYVKLNPALIGGKRSPFWQVAGQGRFEIPLPAGGALAVVIERSERTGPDRFTSVGHLEGQPASRVIFACNQGVVQAMIEDEALNRYTLRHVAGGATQFFQVDPAMLPPCGGSLCPVADGDALTTLARLPKTAVAPRAQGEVAGPQAALTPVPAALAGAAGVQIYVLMAYTTAVKNAAGGNESAQAAMDLALAAMNGDLLRSQSALVMKLAGTAEVSYAGDDFTSGAPNWMETALEAVRKTSDGKMDQLHALRDQTGADLVCLALNRPDSTGTFGIGYLFDEPNDHLNPLYAFSAVQYSSIATSHVVSHELGHNLGCAHARGDSGTTGANDGAYSYSYGYRFPGHDGRQYRTIMAYAPGLQLGYYSNPDVVASEPSVAVAVGVPVGQMGETNNALTIDRNAFEVSAYRVQPVPSYAGTLINVSTRAYTGPGEQQLIGGFVVQGTLPKKILVRAIGPSLAGFGVTGALTDPMLTLVRLGTGGAPNATAGFNDNWSEQAGATEVAAAAVQVGAFALTSGSRDSALLLTLAPGPYTANIEGVAATTGTALVEAYDAEANVTRVINLSTRAYAGKDRPMIGGFVVLGDPAVPKRILIRVLGPTLADYGVTDVLGDPFVSLYDAQGNLLMQNDDWDPPTSTLSGERVSIRGEADLESEKKIFATGYAPGKPVEPAVLLDLRPGAYTVIVEPFESLPAQPAEPGVGIVEVYEITGP